MRLASADVSTRILHTFSEGHVKTNPVIRRYLEVSGLACLASSLQIRLAAEPSKLRKLRIVFPFFPIANPRRCPGRG
jgi:hypothetical protein